MVISRYSDYEIQAGYNRISSMATMAVLPTIVLTVLMFIIQKPIVYILELVQILLLVYYRIYDAVIIKIKKKRKMRIDPDGIWIESFFGSAKTIRYEQIEEAVREGRMYLGRTGMVLAVQKTKICFPYEIGKPSAQQDVDDFYDRLQEHLTVQLPPYDHRGLELLDKRYCYARDRKTYTAVILFFVFLTVFLMAMEGGLTFTVFYSLFIGALECFLLYRLAVVTKLSFRNEIKIGKYYQNFPVAVHTCKWRGLIWFAIVAVLMPLLNYVIINSFFQ